MLELKKYSYVSYEPTADNYLRVVTVHQQKKVESISKDWRRFNYTLCAEMFDKL